MRPDSPGSPADVPPGPAWRDFVHARRRSTADRPPQVAAWLVDDEDLPGLDETWRDQPLHVRVARGAGDVTPALAWAGRSPATARWLGLTLRDDVATGTNVRRVVAALDDARRQGVAPDDPEELSLVLTLPVYAGPPAAGLPSALLSGLDEIAAAEAVLAVPCSGPVRFVADLVEASLDREVAMVAGGCTGPRTGPEAIGWEALLAGVRASLDGDPVEPRLTGEEQAPLADEVVERTRRWLRAAVLT